MRQAGGWRAVAVFTLGALGVAPAWTGPVDLKPVQQRLASEVVQERITGVRELMRLKPAPEAARPLLEKVVHDPEASVRGEGVWATYELLGDKGADLLEQYYNDPDRNVRDSAIRASCRMWNKPRPKDLCKAAFEDPDFAARIEVISTLRESFPKDPGAAEIFRKALKDPAESVVRAGVFGAQAARDAQAVPDLARIARTMGDMAAEPAAAEALATIGTPDAVRELITLLPKPQPGPDKRVPVRPSDVVRAGAARALARIKNPDALPALRTAASDPAIGVRLGAMQGLMDMNDAKSVPLFVKALADGDPRVRRTALRALDRVADPDTKVGEKTVADSVRAVLKEDQDPTVRASAAPVLADLLKERAIPDLLDLKSDLDATVRLEAAGALAGIGKPAADALATFATDADANVRTVAIEGLGQAGSAKHLPVLVKAAEDTSKGNRQVRLASATAIGNFGSAEGIPALAQLAKDTDPGVRQATAVALGKLGGPQAKETLQAMLKDEVAYVRNAARKSLDGLNAKK